MVRRVPRRTDVGRTAQMRLTLEPFVSDAMREPCESYPALRSSQHERYVACVVSFAGSQSSPFFHSLRATEEIFRASVKSAMSGSTP